MDPLFFLYQEDYGIYSRSLAKYLKSLNASVVLSELAQRRKYHADRNELISDERYGDEWFYMTHEKMEERTSLSRKEQDSSLKILIENGLIEQKNFGVPAKRHFRLKTDKILEIYGLSKKHSSLTKTDKLDCPKGANCNDRKGQTVHIDKEPKEEPKEEYIAILSHGSHVKLKISEYDHLIRIHGKSLIDKTIESVNDYCDAHGKTYKNYAAAIRNFLKNSKPNIPSKNSVASNIHPSAPNELEDRIAMGGRTCTHDLYRKIKARAERENKPENLRGWKYKDDETGEMVIT